MVDYTSLAVLIALASSPSVFAILLICWYEIKDYKQTKREKTWRT